MTLSRSIGIAHSPFRSTVFHDGYGIFTAAASTTVPRQAPATSTAEARAEPAAAERRGHCHTDTTRHTGDGERRERHTTRRARQRASAARTCLLFTPHSTRGRHSQCTTHHGAARQAPAAPAERCTAPPAARIRHIQQDTHVDAAHPSESTVQAKHEPHTLKRTEILLSSYSKIRGCPSSLLSARGVTRQ